MFTGTRDLFYSYALNGNLPKRRKSVYPAPATYAAHNPGTLTRVKSSAELVVLIETDADALLYHNSVHSEFRFDHSKNKKGSVALERLQLVAGPFPRLLVWPVQRARGEEGLSDRHPVSVPCYDPQCDE